MGSFKSMATLGLLAVIGAGLYMVINTPEPVPPAEVDGELLAVPDIDEGFDDLLVGDESGEMSSPGGGQDYASAPSSGPPPAWSPSVAESPASGDAVAPTATPELPELPPESGGPAAAAFEPAPSQPAVASTAPGAASPGGAAQSPMQNPFSAQLAGQSSDGTAPVQVNNPFANATSNVPDGNYTPPADNVLRSDSGHSLAGGTPTGGDGTNTSSPAVSESAVVGQANAVQPPAPASPSSTLPTSTVSPFTVARGAAEASLQNGDLSQALLLLSEYDGDPSLTPQEQQELRIMLGQLAGTVIYSTEHRLEQAYRAQGGESLLSVAMQYNVSPELLAKINGLPSNSTLSSGQELKVVRGPFNAVVDPKAGEIRLMLDGRYAGRFAAQPPPVTAPGSWVVRQKSAVPAPQNPGGLQPQLELSPSSPGAGELSIVAGQPQPESSPASIYVADGAMSDLYDILTEGSQVTVIR